MEQFEDQPPVNQLLVDRELSPEVQARRNELFNRYIVPNEAIIWSLVKRYSFSLANVEENFHEVLINFFRGIETYDPKRDLTTWIHIVTKRHVFAIERKRQNEAENRSSTHEYFPDANAFFDNMINDYTPSYGVVSVDNYRRYFNSDVLAVIDELDDMYKNALILQIAGYSLKEIMEKEFQRGALKNMNISTVKSRLHHAHLHLRNNLSRDGNRLYGEAVD